MGSELCIRDRFLSEYNNADRPGGGDGEMSLETGIYTCLTPGFYKISYSGYSRLLPGQETRVQMYHNGVPVDGSLWKQRVSSDAGALTGVQGSRTLVGRLASQLYDLHFPR